MSKSKAVTVKPANKSLVLVDQELQNEIANIKQQIGAPGGGRIIKVEASGNFKLPEGLDLGNEIQAIIVDFSTRKTFYSTPFNPQNPSPPDCYALGKNISEMAPTDPDLPGKQADNCGVCPMNAWGSGSHGNGKACREFRDLALLLVDPENPDAHNAPDAPIYLLSVSPTSLKAYDAIVPVIARALGGPPVKAIVTITATPVGTYAKLSFSDPVPNPDYAAHVGRRGESADLLNRKPDYASYAARQPAVPARRGAAPRPAAGGRR